MLFTGGGSVRMGKNCALGLEYGPRPSASGRTQDLGHSFFPMRTSRPVNNIYKLKTCTHIIHILLMLCLLVIQILIAVIMDCQISLGRRLESSCT